MSLDDISDKWLFVAYSAKKDGSEDGDDYRNHIGSHHAYAGSKGVGRFSCDRLGETLRMQTRYKGAASRAVEVINVHWDLFEKNAKAEFTSVPMYHTAITEFELPSGLTTLDSGTVLEIGRLREEWNREKFKRLRSGLAKLISPFEGADKAFEIHLNVPAEMDEDKIVIAKSSASGINQPADVVNGPIQNFIFDTLRGKTTHLDVKISQDGRYIYSTLTDRGAIIYKIREINKFTLLEDSDFRCNLFFLNRSAKSTFTQRMGIRPVKFGSVFLFKNGIRIYPVGDEGVDTFEIDRRKQQGHARFLGTRDIIGRIDIYGSDDNFRESTSRNQSLIDTPAYEQLLDCFDEKCFRRLERYVVGVNWKDALDAEAEDTSRLRGDHASARITAIVAQLAGSDGVELLDYNHELVRILNERSDGFTEVLSGLRLLAEKSGNFDLLTELEAAAVRYNELQRAEFAAREAAERERSARRDVEREIAQVRQQAAVITRNFEEERKINLFLTSLASLDRETIEILHHQIIIHAAAVNEIINGQFDSLRAGLIPNKEGLITTFENISFQNRKILSTARFATKANFRLDSETIEEDLANYVEEYIRKVAPIFSDFGIRIEVFSQSRGLVRKFKPIEVSILIDNLISNSGKANATKIVFDVDQPSAKELRIVVHDDGIGFKTGIGDMKRLFEKGFTTSSGSGLGLYHVAQILDDLGGSITAEQAQKGARFLIRIKG